MARQLVDPIGPSDWKLVLHMKDDVRPGLPVLWFELEDTLGRAPILGFMNPPHFKTLMENAATLGSPTEVGLYGARTDALLRPVNKTCIKLQVTIGTEPVNLEFDWSSFWHAFQLVGEQGDGLPDPHSTTLKVKDSAR